MRVLILSHSSGAENMGGAEWSLLHMIDLWRRLEPSTSFTVVARSPEGQLQPQLDARGVPHHTIPFDSWVLPVVRESADHVILTDLMEGAAVETIRTLIRDASADLVLTNTIVSPWAAFAAKLEGLPHVWLVHEYGDLDHGLGFRIGRDATFSDVGLLSDLVVANSEAISDHLQRWIPADKIAIAYPPIALSEPPQPGQVVRSSAVSEPPAVLSDCDLSIVMVGRISRSKGQWRLVEAVNRLRADGLVVRATLVGFRDSDDGRSLATEIEAKGLGNLVELVGEHGDPGPFVAAADVAVMASDSEAFGRVTVEYMAAGIPVIAANTGANLELVTDGESGWLFERDSVESLCGAIRDAASSAEERERRGHAARQRVYEVVLQKHLLRDVIVRMKHVADTGPAPMGRLPYFTMELLGFPRFVDQYAADREQIREAVRSSVTWRRGEGTLRAARPVLPVARKAWRAARRVQQLAISRRANRETLNE